MNTEAWVIRAGEKEQIDAILALEQSADEAPHWPRTAYAEIFSPARSDAAVKRCLFVAVSASGALLGFSVGAIPGSAQDLSGELESVAVAPPARRRGIGRALCLAVIAWCRDSGAAGIALEVRAGSPAPIALYRSLGFKDAGRRPRYYSDPPDAALLMQLTL